MRRLGEERDRRRIAKAIADQEAGQPTLSLVAVGGDGSIVGTLELHVPIGIAHLSMSVRGRPCRLLDFLARCGRGTLQATAERAILAA